MKRKTPGAPLTVEYFRERSMTDPVTGCWIWTGAQNRNGYGAMRFGGKNIRPHRAIYEVVAARKLPSSVDVCHRCDVRLCVNPEHLFEGSRTDNMRDCSQKGRIVTPRLAGEACPAARLTADQVLAIRAGGPSSRIAARKYGVSDSSIRAIRAGKVWKSVGGHTGRPEAVNQTGPIRDWDPTEDAIIRANACLGTVSLAAALGRTKSAIRVRASKLGVKLKRFMAKREGVQ